ncbi:MAG: DUF721 domain-containing protein [Bacteroidota bacterium]|nr:DUF721 domain-containing protein [Bacteroidota bacterium]MDP4205695.1 DUF721 domain-containing protein [Bacteroidota bacterium]
MRKSKILKLSDVVQEYLKENHIDNRLKEADLVSSWETIMGRTIALSTSKIYIHNRILFIYLRSSVIRQELFMMREQIRQSLNQHVGGDVIDEVILR